MAFYQIPFTSPENHQAMHSCEYRSRGCAELFDRRFGLRIHLRSCIHKDRRRKLSKKFMVPLIPAPEEQDWHPSLAPPQQPIEEFNISSNLSSNTSFEFEHDNILDEKYLGVIRRVPVRSSRR